MNRKEDPPKKGAPAYMNTYGDMMTLLLTFFVLLFSMSSVDAAKFQAVIDSFNGMTSILDGGDNLMSQNVMLNNGMTQLPDDPLFSNEQQEAYRISQELEAIKKEIEEFIYSEELDSEVGVEKDGDAIVIRFADILLFESGNATLKEQAREVLNILGEQLQSYIDKGYKLSFEGHADNIPIRSPQFPSNWELSASRAIAVARYFIDEKGFNPEMISAEGFGEFMPIGDNSTAEGRAMNRRVELKLTKNN